MFVSNLVLLRFINIFINPCTRQEVPNIDARHKSIIFRIIIFSQTGYEVTNALQDSSYFVFKFECVYFVIKGD